MTLPKKLYHYSEKEIDCLTQERFKKSKNMWPEEGSMKPVGIWFSVEESEDDYSWYDWCKGEQFRLEALRHKYLLKITDDAKMLHLQSPEDIIKFSIQYAANDPFDFGRTSIFQKDTTYIYMISWSKVKAEYDGIIIAPYQWKCRLASETSWYYPWDCSSGCIWNLDKFTLQIEEVIDVESLIQKEEQ